MNEHDSSHPGYFSGWQASTWTCPDCAWQGTGTALSQEFFRELFELHCPNCDHKFAVVTHPGPEETQIAAAAGNQQAQALALTHSAVARRQQSIQDARSAARNNLPDLEGTALTFTFRADRLPNRVDPDVLVVTCNDVEILREPTGYEGWYAIIEITDLLLQQYPGRVAWVDPADAGIELLGDDISAGGRIKEFLREHHVAPPHGPWAMPPGMEASS